MKKYNLGLICGRFGPIHKGHQSIINTSIERCDKTLIFVGSAQESGTLRNPFSADFRMDLIRKVFPDKNKVQIEKSKNIVDLTQIRSNSEENIKVKSFIEILIKIWLEHFICMIKNSCSCKWRKIM